MTQMNAAIREAMVSKAVETSGIKQRQRNLIERRAAFAEAVRQHLMGLAGVSDSILNQQAREVKKMMESPYCFHYFNHYNNWKSSFDVNINGMRLELYFNGLTECGDSHLDKDEKGKAVELKRWVPCYRKDLKHDEFADQVMAFAAEQTKLKNDLDILKATVNVAAKRFRTVEKMLEAWPDAAELLPKDLPVATRGTAVALSVNDLNAICGIPTGKA